MFQKVRERRSECSIRYRLEPIFWGPSGLIQPTKISFFADFFAKWARRSGASAPVKSDPPPGACRSRLPDSGLLVDLTTEAEPRPFTAD
jgi:hypothetical protein